MLIKFQSKNAGDVVMYREHAKRILDLLDKNVDRGIVTAAEAAGAVAAIEAAIAESRLHPASEELKRDVDVHHGGAGDDNDHEPGMEISFAARSHPLLELLRGARDDKRDVMWGV